MCCSQSLFTLNLIEDYLSKSVVPNSEDPWMRNRNYFSELTFQLLMPNSSFLLLHPWEWLRSIVMSMSLCVCVCVCVCLSVREDISGTTCAIFTKFLCMLPISSRMVGVSASVNLPLHHKVQKFSSGTGSPRWSRKKGRKMVVVVVMVAYIRGSILLRHVDNRPHRLLAGRG